jgi:hypothetical protein
MKMNQHRQRPEWLINTLPRRLKCKECQHGHVYWGEIACDRGLKWPDVGQCMEFKLMFHVEHKESNGE